ncbi:sugar diacid recognition domain-containing protein [Vibrio sp. 10N.222.51.C8]|jgi:carbohydrate diacid regulator|uniref:sugar diacid recognition domain-containing protein n=1 Tax=Vibrio TaxID=662 RepID=UPI0002ECC524|nr:MULTISPECIES: sugar diacid recognition domain-containing protein [Vibrio]OCH51121.1 XRE family transcriptional regulator [Vibrio sp. ZF57]OEF08955.1 XRE family transcriptional regulator [Vibrio crassostreae 9ZC77]PMK10747.1 XRE family transcriptional regulator [Vibrio sp. 10N.261.54.E10]PMK20968.1 XRE family transcriptional regulator [Vibrio sp. 10N.261.54.C3]PMN95799.1 XRE family transcriptional regulator [Vibrio sp. 10N.222.55.F9]
MQLNEMIAKQIVERTMKIIPHSINVMDNKGRIIGSSDPTRLYQKHEGAVLAITESRVVNIDEATAEHLKGVKPGVNLPILFQDNVIGAIGVSGTLQQVHHFGELVKMTAELIVEQAVLMSQVEWNKRHREELVLQLIRGSTLNDMQLQSIAQRLDLDLAQPRIAAIVKVLPIGDTAPSLENLQQLVHLLEYPERDNLVGILSVSQNEVVVLKPITLIGNSWSKDAEAKRVKLLLKRIKKEAKFQIKIALGDYFTGLSGLARSYDTAELTMRSVGNRPGDMFFYQDYRLPAIMSSLLQDPWIREQLEQSYLHLQQQDSKGILIKTLKTYLKQNCDSALTCNELHIHRNTLRYRTDKINQITSLNINNIDDLFQLYIAINLFHWSS